MANGKRIARIYWQAAGLAFVAVAAAFALFRAAVYEKPGAAAATSHTPDTQQPAEAEEALVVSARGSVQRARGSGPWVRVSPGDRLRADDAIRTGKGSRADLRIDDRSQISVAESTELNIRELTREVHRLRLRSGRIAVDYAADGRRLLRVEDEASGGVAEATEARFSVLSNGTTIAVATETGTVNLRAAGADAGVAVPAGRQATARRGQTPSAPEEIPAALLLKVAGAVGSHDICARVEGVVGAGAEVRVDGSLATVSEDGRFSVAVPRDPRDKRAVLVATRDALGREERRKVPCAADEGEGAIRDFAIHWRRRTP